MDFLKFWYSDLCLSTDCFWKNYFGICFVSPCLSHSIPVCQGRPLEDALVSGPEILTIDVDGTSRLRAYDRIQPRCITSWWLDQPIWKICSSNWIISLSRGWKIKNLWNHHLDNNNLHSPSLTWNLKMMVSNGNLLFQVLHANRKTFISHEPASLEGWSMYTL